MPLISLGGTKERSTQRIQEMEDLATLSKKGRFIAVPEAGHHIQIEAPRAVVGAIREILGVME